MSEQVKSKTFTRVSNVAPMIQAVFANIGPRTMSMRTTVIPTTVTSSILVISESNESPRLRDYARFPFLGKNGTKNTVRKDGRMIQQYEQDGTIGCTTKCINYQS